MITADGLACSECRKLHYKGEKFVACVLPFTADDDDWVTWCWECWNKTPSFYVEPKQQPITKLP